MEIATIPLAVLQNETHPYYHDIPMKEYMAKLNALNKGERSWNVPEEDAEKQFTASKIDFDPQE